MPSPEPKRVLDPVGTSPDPLPAKALQEPPAKRQKVAGASIKAREAKYAHVPNEIDGVEKPLWFASCMEDEENPFVDEEDEADEDDPRTR